MNLSHYGFKKIEGYEGWGKLIKEGPHAGCYAAYQDTFHGKLDIPTIGPGLTEDVHMGLVLTRDECAERFRNELKKHEANVNRVVKVEISQNAFDALVALSYNVEAGVSPKSSVIKRLNKGDMRGAAEAFKLYNRGLGGVIDGLVYRRASEAALFLKPDGEPNPHAMPATVTASAASIARPVVAAVTAATTLAVPSLPLPSVPEAVTKSLENADSWKAIGEHAWTLGQFALGHPLPSVGVVLAVLTVWLWPKPKGAA